MADRGGARNRRAGHTAERAVAKWLRENGYPDACTTRQKLGHDGSRQPGDVDVCDGSGLVVEVKNVAASAWPQWLRQTREQAQERSWVVVRKTPGTTDVGEWIAAVPGCRRPVSSSWTGRLTPESWMLPSYHHPTAVTFLPFAVAVEVLR